MRVLVSSLALLGLALIIIAGADAGGDKDKKEVTIKGKITCAKCELKTITGATKCETVIAVKKDKKDVIYYFDKVAHGKYHDDICSEGKKGTVTGTVKKDGKKEVISVKELKYDD